MLLFVRILPIYDVIREQCYKQINRCNSKVNRYYYTKHRLDMQTLYIWPCFGMFSCPQWNFVSFWTQQQVPRSFIVYLHIATTHRNLVRW